MSHGIPYIYIVTFLFKCVTHTFISTIINALQFREFCTLVTA